MTQWLGRKRIRVSERDEGRLEWVYLPLALWKTGEGEPKVRAEGDVIQELGAKRCLSLCDP